MTVLRARCSCGQLALDIEGEPQRVSVCHCLECQRRTGSAFGVQARFARDTVRVDGSSTSYLRKGDSGQAITFHFCSLCGSTVYWTLENHAELIAVAAGALAGLPFPAPWRSVYESRRLPWVKIDDNVQRED
jgi:hypothetical protein